MQYKMMISLADIALDEVEIQSEPLFKFADARIGKLFYEAYKGSVDDEGETLEDWQDNIAAFRDGEFGKLLVDASRVLTQDGSLVSASVIGVEDDYPYIIAVVTAPEQRGKHLAEAVLLQSMKFLQEDYEQLILYVNGANEYAMNLYKHMGFQIIEAREEE